MLDVILRLQKHKGVDGLKGQFHFLCMLVCLANIISFVSRVDIVGFDGVFAALDFYLVQ